MAKVKANDLAIQKFTDMAIDDIFNNAGVRGRITDVRDLVKLGIYGRDALDPNSTYDPRTTEALINAFNTGMVNNDYTKFFKFLQTVKDFDQRKTTAFEDKYNEIWPNAGGKSRAMISIGEKAFAMQGLRLSARKGKSDIDQVLSLNKSIGPRDIWQLLSGLSYSHNLHKEIAPSFDYLEKMQDALIGEYHEKDSGTPCKFKDRFDAGLVTSIKLKADYGIDDDKLIEYINGSKVSQKLDFYGETDSEVNYKLDSINKRDLTNVGMHSVRKAAMQVHSVIAEPFFREKLGLGTYLESLSKPNPDIDPFLSFYKGESKDEVVGDSGRWTRFCNMINSSFSERAVGIHYGKKDFKWETSGWLGADASGNSYSIQDVMDKFLKVMIEDGAMAAATEKEFAYFAAKAMASPEITSMLNPDKVYASAFKSRGIPGSDAHIKERDANGVETNSNMRCVTARIFSDGDIYAVQTSHNDPRYGKRILDTYGIDAKYMNEDHEIDEDARKDAVMRVNYAYRDANLDVEKTIVDIGTNPILEIFQARYEQERILEEMNERNNSFQGVLLVRDLKTYQENFQIYSAAVREFI